MTIRMTHGNRISKFTPFTDGMLALANAFGHSTVDASYQASESSLNRFELYSTAEFIPIYKMFY